MKTFIRQLTILVLSGLSLSSAAQNITGTWEGDLGTDQYMQLNVIQKKDIICGYTYDYVKNEKMSHCRAYFTGYYDRKEDMYIFTGTSFIENSGSHMLMRLKLRKTFVDGEIMLEGESSIKSAILSFLYGGAVDEVQLKRVSSRPYIILPGMQDCFPEEKIKEEKIKKDTLVYVNQYPPGLDSLNPETKITGQKTDSTPVVKEKTEPAKDSSPVVINTEIPKKDTLSAIDKEKEKRKDIVQRKVEVNTRQITLYLYDNATVDDDTISIYYNGRLLLAHQRLSEKAVVLPLLLDENTTRHEIVLFAENLGSIPPNTALVVVQAGDKRYELFSSANLEENAVLIFEYKPK